MSGRRARPSLTFKGLTNGSPSRPRPDQPGFAAETFLVLSARTAGQRSLDASAEAAQIAANTLAQLGLRSPEQPPPKPPPATAASRAIPKTTTSIAPPSSSSVTLAGSAEGGAVAAVAAAAVAAKVAAAKASAPGKPQIAGSPPRDAPGSPPSFTLPDDFPRDRINIVDSKVLVGVPVVMRSAEERGENPERLNLDNLGFTVCPILEHEYHLRLVNFQHNRIPKIEHLSNLKSLIFLDLFNNSISQISGLESLSCLRVLMLGCNKITSISAALEYVPHLDVLDLHSNQISTIQNLESLTKLRVLNLSDNRITRVENLQNLQNLTELNLRQNRIASVSPPFELLHFLERLNLSENVIEHFADVAPVMRALSIQELAVTRNPLCDALHYRETWIDGLRLLRIFDGRRVSDEERRVAGINLRKESDKKKDAARVAATRAEREADITRIKAEWTDMMAATQESNQARITIHCFAEMDGSDCLHFYGNPQDALERTWPGTVTSIHFQYAVITDITSQLYRVRNRFTNVAKITVQDTTISTFKHIAAFAVLRKVEHLVIHEDQPLCKNVSLWKKYALFRLWQLPLKSINGVDLTEEHVQMAKAAFRSIGALLAEQEQASKRWDVEEPPQPPESSKKRWSGSDAKPVIGSRKVVRTALKDRVIPTPELAAFARETIADLGKQAAFLVHRKAEVAQLWESQVAAILTEALSDAVAF